MKNLIIVLVFTFTSFSLFAQSEKYISAMQDNLSKVSYNASPDELMQIGNTFERIGAAEKEEWLPSYYASLMYMYVAQKSMKDSDKLSMAVDKAWENIEKTEAISGEHDEVLALKAYVYFGYIWKNPMINGARYSKKAYSLLEKAMELNPNNPRPYYLKGQNTFYTPSMWGGGAENAKPLLLTAKEKFDTFEKTDALMPQWGEEGNNYMLKQVGVEVPTVQTASEE